MEKTSLRHRLAHWLHINEKVVDPFAEPFPRVKQCKACRNKKINEFKKLWDRMIADWDSLG